ncbi:MULTISPECIES: TetR family transcriptional regulator [unclassified Curtobacterium]|uniref:TetR/AcrR family transcriptional regulator n=1 Tax=unclassified Curtobacterium TaxID=257496 RepID=UPI001054066E|nr:MULTISPECIES: TetR family transcriptional regulator [unclassified Curtobacterium]MBF4585658.1 TetR family transcriptional regulator [Curtobacterium sp. VKM Ac-2887]TCL72491.1 TetR family transcriptional regulator [Curtobacterium sp. PhB128]TCL90614.1 TetR family transcriptional regulator [Curtobacterium sp. PhB138]TCU43181.1 TetR family transcriptional regulator [Curtobacterium sp. PhB146]
MVEAEPNATAGRPRGRRPGVNDTRQAVLDAARARFATDGYAAASIRKIAADAGVDAALVMRAYGSKDELFAASMAMPSEAAAVLSSALDGPANGIGERFVSAFLGLWTAPATSGPLLATFRSAVTNEQAATHLRAFVRGRVLEAYAPHFPDVPDAALRATLVSSMLIGVVVGRQVVGIDALVDAEPDDIVTMLAPVVQSILVPTH